LTTKHQGGGRSKSPKKKPVRKPGKNVSSLANKTGYQIIVSAGLLNIFGVGTVIIGESGLGKSESSLELISRGHKFISDDVVEVYQDESGWLWGRSPSLTKNFMEIRGLGIINIREIFGAKALLDESRIDLVIRLKKWSKKMEIDRLGLDFPEDYFLAGVRVPQLHIMVAPGRNVATLIEVACRVFVLRRKGYQAAPDIVNRLERQLARKNEKSS
jgi:HPr kinase/phosphorylase